MKVKKPVEDPAAWVGRKKGTPRPAATYRGARRNKRRQRSYTNEFVEKAV